MLTWIFVIQAVNVTTDDQQVGIDQCCVMCGEIVIVANFQFVGRDAVVFVNDRYAAHAEQFAQGIASVDETMAVLQIIGSQ